MFQCFQKEEGGGAAVEKEDFILLDQAGGEHGDAFLFLGVHDALFEKAAFGLRGDGGVQFPRASVNAHEKTPGVQGVQIPAYGYR